MSYGNSISISDNWIRNFKKRNSIVFRTPPMKSQERIDAENYSHLKEFYLLLEGIYKKYSFSPARIFNVDESPFFWNL